MNNKVEFCIMYSILCCWNEWESAKIACRTQINEKNRKWAYPATPNAGYARAYPATCELIRPHAWAYPATLWAYPAKCLSLSGHNLSLSGSSLSLSGHWAYPANSLHFDCNFHMLVMSLSGQPAKSFKNQEMWTSRVPRPGKHTTLDPFPRAVNEAQNPRVGPVIRCGEYA